MQVILCKDVEKLGLQGDTITVKPGYAINFLIPRGLVFPATPHNLRRIAEEKKREEKKREKAAKEAALLAAKLNETSCTISVQAGEEDKLFGSVTREDIEEALKAKGINVDRKHIELEETIKKLGVYRVPIRLHPEVAAEIKVWVIKE